MSAERWFEQCGEVLTKIRTTQAEQIRAAAKLIADAAQAGGGVHFHDTGHCSREPIHRAGGLCMVRPFQFSLSVETLPAPKRMAQWAERASQITGGSEEELASLAVRRSAMSAGDALIVSSVSGRSASVVEVAMAARRLGVKVIAITNVSYSRAVASRHASGKRLCEVADVVVDNCGVVGDALLNVEGVDTGVAPSSGVAFCYIIWGIVSEAVAQMVARGLSPHVYRSVNLPDGEEYNARAEEGYRETGV
jgi:uncharacterized phosphosugar-binding protein